MNDAAIWLLAFVVVGTAAVLLEQGMKAIQRRAGEPVAMAMHPSNGEHRIRPVRVDVGDSGAWEVSS